MSQEDYTEITEHFDEDTGKCKVCNKKPKKCICILSEDEYSEEQILDDINEWKHVLETKEQAECIFDYLSTCNNEYSSLFNRLSFDDIWETFFPNEFEIYQKLTTKQ